MSILHDEQFIILISLIIFFLLFGRKIYVSSVAYLDKNISKIHNNLEESKKRLLSSSSKLHSQKEELETFVYNKDNVIYQIQTKVESYYEKTIEQLNKKIKNQQIALNIYLDNTYNSKVYETEKEIISTIVILTKKIIREEITPKMHQQYINQSISEIKEILNNE